LGGNEEEGASREGAKTPRKRRRVSRKGAKKEKNAKKKNKKDRKKEKPFGKCPSFWPFDPFLG
jgi:hypothetical protein